MTSPNYVLLEQDYEGNAILFIPQNEDYLAHFLVVSGYQENPAKWGPSQMAATVAEAASIYPINPLKQAHVLWQKEDFEYALENAGFDPTDTMINDIMYRCQYMQGWKDSATMLGNEIIDTAVADYAAAHPEQKVA